MVFLWRTPEVSTRSGMRPAIPCAIYLCGFAVIVADSAHPGELAKAFHPGARRHRAVLLHHRAHLQILLDYRVYVLHGGAAAARNPLAPLAVNHIVVAALFVGHRVDDRLHLLQ